MTYREKLAIEHPDKITDDPCHYGGCVGCPASYGYSKPPLESCFASPETCAECWDREIPETIPEVVDITPNAGCGAIITKPYTDGTEKIAVGHIKDSGNRREFGTGAVRDMAEGKGRCDLMPLDVIGELLGDTVYTRLEDFLRTGNTTNLYIVLSSCGIFHDLETMLLEVAKHFEEGCKKYGENNWRKGIPVKFFIDSAVRHYLKFRRGDKDEPHDRAFCWNILCAIWTHDHKPELRINPTAEEPETK